MKNLFNTISRLIGVSLFAYCLASFMEMDLNANNWSSMSRGFVILGTLAQFLLIIVQSEIDKLQ